MKSGTMNSGTLNSGTLNSGTMNSGTTTSGSVRPGGSAVVPAWGEGGDLAAAQAVAVLRDELAHVLATPVAFFAGLVRQLESGSPLAADDLEIAAEEVERLRARIATLRAPTPLRLEASGVDLAPLVHGIAAASPAGAVLSTDVPEGLRVRSDAGALTLVVRTMVALAAGAFAASEEAPAPASEVGVPGRAVRVRAFTDAGRATVLVSPGVDGSEAGLAAAVAWAALDRAVWADPTGQSLAFSVARGVARAAGGRLVVEQGSGAEGGSPVLRLDSLVVEP